MVDRAVEIKPPTKTRTLSGAPPALAVNTILVLLGFTLFYYLLYFSPVGYIYFVSEDLWAEWATFVGWAMAFCLLAWTLFKDRGLRKPGFFLLGLGSLLVALEEISWGQRVLGLHTPEFFAARNVKGELNLHNFISFVDYYLPAIGLAVFLWSIVLPLLTRRSMRLRRWCGHLGIPLVPIHLWPFFLLAIYFLIDASLKKSEVAELCLGIAIAVLSLDLALTTRRGAEARGAAGAVATAGMLATIGMLTAVLVQAYPWPEKLRSNLNSFAAFRFPAAGMHRQAAMLFDYMNRNPQFLTPDTHFYQGALLMRMGRHAQAREILELTLAEQERLQQRDPDDPVPRRNAGLALTVLARPQEAKRAFLDAIEKDRARLERANDARTKALVHWSLGETLHAMGDSEAASKQFSMARALIPHPKRRAKLLPRAIERFR